MESKMKRLTALVAIILSISGYAYADNLSAENKKFVESVIKKQFPKVKYEKSEKRWITSDNLSIEYDFKEIITTNGKIGALVINEKDGELGEASAYLYGLNYANNKWNIQTTKKLSPDDVDRKTGEVIKLGSGKLGFNVFLGSYGGTMGSESQNAFYYLINAKYKKLSGCFDQSYRSNPLEIECKSTIRKDLPETDGFYPVEFTYTLTKYQVKESYDEAPKGWEYAGGSYIRKLIGKRKGKVLSKFDSTKQAYVLPASFVKALTSNTKDEALWSYFKK